MRSSRACSCSALVAMVVALARPAEADKARLRAGYEELQALGISDPRASLLRSSLLMAEAAADRRPAWIARGAYAQAGAAKALGKLDLADDALALAVANDAPTFTRLAQAARVNLLRSAGDHDEARRLGQELVDGTRDDPGNHLEAMLQLALVDVEARRFASAKLHLLDLIALTTRADHVAAAAMNLAFIEDQLGRCGGAVAYLQLASLVDGESFDWWFLAARVALGCRDRARAAAALDVAIGMKPEGQWIWQVLDRRGQLAELAGDAVAAARAYHDAIAAAEALRRDGGRLEPIVAGQLVEPYEHAIDLAAAAGDWRGALGLVLRHERGAALADPDGAIDAALAAWRGRTLVILVRGRGRIWRLDVVDGQVSGASLGAVARLGASDLLDDRDPEAVAIATTLGAAIPAGDVVHVHLLGDLAALPLAALRAGGDRVIRRTALVRAVHLAPDPRPRMFGTGRIVLGDPAGELDGARREATWVGQTLGVSPRLGAAADRAALAAARGADVLHIAGHARWTLDGPSLPLADASLTAADLAALEPAPRLVVLASCFSARARDRGGWTSLASGFLDAGAELVISTQTSVDDAAARRLVEAFYRHGGVAAPAEALRQAQLELAAAGVDPHEWASFVAIAAPPRASATAAAPR